MSPEALITQGFGVAALVLNVSSMQFKDRQRLLLFNMLACGCMAVHFFLLGAYTGAGMFLLAIVRAVVFRRFSAADRPLWPMVTMLAAFVVMGIATWHGAVSILPIISTIFVTIGLWQHDTQRMRTMVVIGPIMWFTYNTIVGSIPGMIMETISFGSIIVGLWRHRRRGESEVVV